MKPLVSIITPCFNGETYLKRYFDSILNQSYPNLELIFVDDGSADRTADIAEGYREALESKGIKYIILQQENSGQAAALNRGLKYFTGEYLTWPDSDDEMTSDCIEKKVDFLEKHPEFDFCICRVEGVDEDNLKTVEIYERTRTDEKKYFEDIIFVRNMLFMPGAYMVRRSILEKAIPDFEIYSGPGGQNAQILLPVSYYGKLGYMDDVLYKYYIRSESHSHSVNTSTLQIRQLEYYEQIVLATLQKMGTDVLNIYKKRIEIYFTQAKFGNALDSKNPVILKQYYAQKKKYGLVTMKDRIRYFRYTNPVLRKLQRLD